MRYGLKNQTTSASQKLGKALLAGLFGLRAYQVSQNENVQRFAKEQLKLNAEFGPDGRDAHEVLRRTR